MPIGERHAVVQRERVRETVVGSLPGAGDPRLQLVGVAAGHQRLVHVAEQRLLHGGALFGADVKRFRRLAFDADRHGRVGDERAEGCDGILAACQRQSQPQQHTEHDRDAEEDQPARRLGFQITFPPVFIHAPESS